MADFPTSIFTQRELNNINGQSFDAQKKTTIFAEDIIALGDEVAAIENYIDDEIMPNLGGGGAGLIVDNAVTILQSTPTENSVAYAYDTKKMYIWNDATWAETSLTYYETSAAPDIGYIQMSDKNGYTREFIDDKKIVNASVGAFDAPPYEGAIRYDQSKTPPQLAIYARGSWQDIFYDFTMKNARLQHTPKKFIIDVASGNSENKGLTGQPHIRGYKMDIGAYPSAVVIDGGILGN